jgi:hypothetical protein
MKYLLRALSHLGNVDLEAATLRSTHTYTHTHTHGPIYSALKGVIAKRKSQSTYVQKSMPAEICESFAFDWILR